MSFYVSPYLGNYDTTLSSSGTSPAAQQVFYQYESTDANVANFFVQNMSAIYEIFNRPVDSTGESVPPLSATDAENLQAVFTNLYNLAKGTSSVNAQINPSGVAQLFYLTKDMIGSLDVIVRSFQAVGAFDPTSAISKEQLQRWKDFSLLTPAIQEAMTVAMRSTSTNRSIQAMIEMEYVAAGNDLVENKLTDLETALTASKDMLDLLADIQNVQNKVITIQRSNVTMPYIVDSFGTGDDSEEQNQDYADDFQRLNSAFFTAPQFPVPNSTLMGYSGRYIYSIAFPRLSTLANGMTIPALPPVESYKLFSATLTIRYEKFLVPNSITASGEALFAKLLSYKARLSALLPQISAILGSDALEENSLYGRAAAVLSNLKTLFVGGSSTAPIQAENLTGPTQGVERAKALFRWLTDSNAIAASLKVGSLQPGDSQTAISAAITSAEGLNDTQKEAVRNFLFVFEEFYKSASAALQRISQMIEKMAGNINR